MTRWLEDLRAELAAQRSHGLYRSLRPTDRCDRWVERDGRSLLNLASNDYLGLATHPTLSHAAAEAAERRGTGAGASRLISGHQTAHQRLETRFAAFKHAEAALLLPAGFLANLAVLRTLAGPDDLICLDKLDHASLIDAARSTGARVRAFPHGHLSKLERQLDSGRANRRRFIVTDSVFSVDGDCADLPALCRLRDRYDAILVVDDAHGTGVLGETGGGLAERQGVAGSVDVTVSTASKALGSLGGLVTANALVVEALINFARPFIYTTAVPPPLVAAIDAALDVVEAEPWRRHRLASLAATLRRRLRERGWPIRDDPTPIVPVPLGDAEATVAWSSRLADHGFYAPAIRPPTVPPGGGRLRLSLRADMADEDVDRLVAAIGDPP